MKIKSLILATVVSIIVFTSCDDFLKVNPDDALPPRRSFERAKRLGQSAEWNVLYADKYQFLWM